MGIESGTSVLMDKNFWFEKPGEVATMLGFADTLESQRAVNEFTERYVEHATVMQYMKIFATANLSAYQPPLTRLQR